LDLISFVPWTSGLLMVVLGAIVTIARTRLGGAKWTPPSTKAVARRLCGVVSRHGWAWEWAVVMLVVVACNAPVANAAVMPLLSTQQAGAVAVAVSGDDVVVGG
jgi:hypothetical protein